MRPDLLKLHKTGGESGAERIDLLLIVWHNAIIARHTKEAAMAVLRGYTYGPIHCGVCGTNYIMVEEGPTNGIVVLRCFEGHRAEAPNDDPVVKQLLKGVTVESEAAEQQADEEITLVPLRTFEGVTIIVSLLAWLIDGWQWGLVAFIIGNLIMLAYKIKPRFFTEP